VSSPPLICLITPGHISTTPRLVKNADALFGAGYRVHVVAGAPFPPAEALDLDILASARWTYTKAAYRSGPIGFGRKVARLASRRLFSATGYSGMPVVARAHFAGTRSLTRAAARIPAQLYLGHCLAALPVAARAARTRACPYGFDIKDYHDEETDAAIGDPVERRIRQILQSRFLPGCGVLTSASPLIASKYEESYGVESQVVLNVFPLSQAPGHPVAPGPVSEQRPAVFYWFSQTIGPNRGLESAVAIISSMRTPSELHVRGFVAPDYAASLQSLASRSGLRRPVCFLPPASPNEMARLAAAADLGLSLEQSHPINRDICLTNKIFVYLLAGIPQLLSNTTAQTALAPRLGDAALVCDLSRTQETAACLDSFFADHDRVAKARNAAWRLARERYCWDVEKEILLNSTKAILPLPN
jgi:glycosyltransferase involved in cell wall biosynthesis